MFFKFAPERWSTVVLQKNELFSLKTHFYLAHFYLWNTGLETGLGTLPPHPPPLPLKIILKFTGVWKRRQFCLQSLGTKGTLHTLPTLQKKTQEFFPQALKHIVNLSCYFLWSTGLEIASLPLPEFFRKQSSYSNLQ